MDTSFFTEKTHPIRNTWLLKSNLVYIVLFLFLGAYFYQSDSAFSRNRELGSYLYVGFITIVLGLRAGLGALFRSRYHYSIGQGYMRLDQQIIKKRQLEIPITQVLSARLEKDFLDDLFGLANVHVQYEARSRREAVKEEVIDTAAAFMGKHDPVDSIGFTSTKVFIPGLGLEHARAIVDYLNKK